MRLISVLICFSVTVSQAQDVDNLLYAHENLKIRDFFPLDGNHKLISKVQQDTGPLTYYLLNDNNIFVDTLEERYYIEDIHPLQNNFLLRGRQALALFTMNGGSLMKIWSDTLENRHEHPIQFTGSIIAFEKKKKHHTLLRLDTAENAQIASIEVLKKAKLNNRLIRQLPVAYGLSKDKLYVFNRDCQTLITVYPDFQSTTFKLPFTKDEIWSFFYDWRTDRKYFISTTESQNQLYQLIEGELKFIKDITVFPQRIYNDNLVYCEGSIKSKCDYYYYPIYKRGDGSIMVFED